MLRARHGLRMASDLMSFGARTGRWWVPIAIVLISVAAVVALTAKVVVPSATYVLF